MADKKRHTADKTTSRRVVRPSDFSGSIKRTRGRPRFIPTEEQRTIVTLGKGAGLTHAQIASLIRSPKPISVDTLERYFRDELDNGEARVTAMVAGNLFKIATSPTHKNAVLAAIFWLKTRAGWKPDASASVTVEARSAAPNGGEEAPITFTIDLGPVPRSGEDADDA